MNRNTTVILFLLRPLSRYKLILTLVPFLLLLRKSCNEDLRPRLQVETRDPRTRTDRSLVETTGPFCVPVPGLSNHSGPRSNFWVGFFFVVTIIFNFTKTLKFNRTFRLLGPCFPLAISLTKVLEG